jgi:hypothetical protein
MSLKYSVKKILPRSIILSIIESHHSMTSFFVSKFELQMTGHFTIPLVISLSSRMAKIDVTLNKPNVSGLERIFLAIDTDRSGTLTLEEILAFRNRVIPRSPVSFENFSKDFAAAGKALHQKLNFEDSINALIGIAVDGLLSIMP